jgi:hypothetical protein
MQRKNICGFAAIAALLAVCILILRRLPGVAAPEEHNWFLLAAYGWTGMLLHEAGHAVAGTLAGYRLSLFRVVPFEIRRSAQLQFAWHGRLSGGYIGMARAAGNAELRHAFMIAGGPLANLLTFLICWWLLASAVMTLGPGYAFLHGLMTFSLFSAAVNLAPLQFGESKTDGRRIFEALFVPARTPADAEAETSRPLAA